MRPEYVRTRLRDVPVLVTGGAGYVGSAAAHLLARSGARVTVFDDLSHGHAWAARGLDMVHGDVRDAAAVQKALSESRAVGVCHFAALASISHSYEAPDAYADVNVRGTRTVVESATAAGVRALAYASTCAIYAPRTDGVALREGDPEAPDSPYARTKGEGEQIVRDADARGDLRTVAFRFFNAAGADREANVGEVHEPETHLIPRALQWALGRAPFAIFGTDYPTPDGTCVRDYVHVVDLAWAHARAIAAMLGGDTNVRGVINLGSGVGTSVRELVRRVGELTSTQRECAVAARRSGDAAVLVASSERARALLGWAPTRDLDGILADALWWERGGALTVTTPSAS